MQSRPDIILASSSQVRENLLTQIGYKVEMKISPDINEDQFNNEKVEFLVKRLSSQKAHKVLEVVKEKHQVANDYIIIAADTNATVGRRVLEKTYDIEVARSYLNLISGRRHKLYTGVTAIRGSDLRAVTKVVTTVLKFKRFSKQEIEEYLLTNEWQGCSGGYSIDRQAAKYLKWISGSYSNVLGLPLYEVEKMIISLGG